MTENPDNPVLVPREALTPPFVRVRVTAVAGGFYLEHWYADGTHTQSTQVRPPGSYVEFDFSGDA